MIGCVLPNVFSTKMIPQELHRKSYIPVPRDYVRLSVRTVGVEGRTSVYPSHRCQQVLLGCVAILSIIIGVDLGPKVILY
ncbi:unnamed protein product [Oppiella nova]|uniref:Uncharacterized protein n=1 Tax=Oppiella nova TaxID=334625 RepID=A0A7R9MNC3_9ACAR|nr:unnamed protein product [Oppiella nova]CAG2180195.1 unnamed protein product [Oppiella nova]